MARRFTACVTVVPLKLKITGSLDPNNDTRIPVPRWKTYVTVQVFPTDILPLQGTMS